MSTWPGEELQVIVYQEENRWVGQCLQVDIAAQAETWAAAADNVQRALIDHIAAARLAGRTPFSNLPPAPPRYWELFENSAVLPYPSHVEIRVAPVVIIPLPTERRIA